MRAQLWPLGGSITSSAGFLYYLFTTAAASCWEVLEIPEGINGRPVFGLDGSITYEHGGHIYTLNHKIGKWDDFDTRAILNAPEDQDNAKSKPRSTP